MSNSLIMGRQRSDVAGALDGSTWLEFAVLSDLEVEVFIPELNSNR